MSKNNLTTEKSMDEKIEEKYTKYLDCETDTLELTIDEAIYILENDEEKNYVSDLLQEVYKIILSDYKRVLKENEIYKKNSEIMSKENLSTSEQLKVEIKENFRLKNQLENNRKEYQETYKDVREELKELKKENEELKQDKNHNYQMIALAQNEMLGYMQGYEDGKKSKRSAVAYIVENQQYYILNKQIEHYKEYIEKLQKENEKFKKERQIVGIPVRNKRDGRIGIVLHQWESGSVAVLESINPRVINTHDSWNTLEIVTDEVKDGNDTNVGSI